MNAANPVYAAFTMEQVEEAWRPCPAAAENLVWAAGWTVGPFVSVAVRAGFGFDAGFRALFGMMLGLYTVGILYSWVVLRPREQARSAL